MDRSALAAGELGRAACPAALIEAALCQRLARRATDAAVALRELAEPVATGRRRPPFAFGDAGGDPRPAGRDSTATGRGRRVRVCRRRRTSPPIWSLPWTACGDGFEQFAIVANDPAAVLVRPLPGSPPRRSRRCGRRGAGDECRRPPARRPTSRRSPASASSPARSEPRAALSSWSSNMRRRDDSSGSRSGDSRPSSTSSRTA